MLWTGASLFWAILLVCFAPSLYAGGQERTMSGRAHYFSKSFFQLSIDTGPSPQTAPTLDAIGSNKWHSESNISVEENAKLRVSRERGARNSQRCTLGLHSDSIFCCGHRGARKSAPENTIPAFQAALRSGANCLEMDVHRTSDGELVVMHERTMQEFLLVDKARLSTRAVWEQTQLKHVRAKVEEMTLKDIKRLDAGDWFGSGFEGTPVPTLAEVIDFLWEENLFLMVELKAEARCDASRVANSSDQEDAYWDIGKWRILLCSSSCLFLALCFYISQMQMSGDKEMSPLKRDSLHLHFSVPCT
jgi:hypothetical protein